MKHLMIFALSCFVLISTHAQNLIPQNWKIKTGNDPQWSSPQFDDSGWLSISPLQNWESQGIPDYDGYAWYRASVVIPSSLKSKAVYYSGLLLQLGKIDDVDSTFLNGVFIGKTGGFPPNFETKFYAPREYLIPLDLILWDQPNTIAVKVFDVIGGGGLYGGPVEIFYNDLIKNLTIEAEFPHEDFIIRDQDPKEAKLKITNSTANTVSGNILVDIISDFGKDISTISKDITISEGKTIQLQIPLPSLEPGFYSLRICFRKEEFSRKVIVNFGVEPEKIKSPLTRQPDFDAYWARAKKELAAVDPQYKIRRIDSLCTVTRNVYQVEMRSLGNVLIRAWYSVPVKPGKYPAILALQGYSGSMQPFYANYGDTLIGMALDIRGHGNSKDNFNPGFPGYLLYQIGDKEQYVYRGAYMDCTRAVDFLFSRTEVDTTKVAVEGGSQGGALTYATAALNGSRITVCVAQVPFLSDFEDYFRIAIWPDNEFKTFVEVQKKIGWAKIYETLSYIDIKNLAPMIKAPLLMGVGLKDEVCPPHINFAAYNQVPGEKRYIAYPNNGHGLPDEMRGPKMDFILEKFKMKR